MSDITITVDTIPEPNSESINGLTQDEVISLRSQYGFNDIPEEK
ncbi:MAG: hypothetical protein CVV33_10555, partial [Methanomicrobiales archaeon HGW-Methanomicrobiales-4]